MMAIRYYNDSLGPSLKKTYSHLRGQLHNGKMNTEIFQEVLDRVLVDIAKGPKYFHNPLVNEDLASLVDSRFKGPWIHTWQLSSWPVGKSEHSGESPNWKPPK